QLSRGIVFPSHLRSEAFGISLLEGAMFGKPMISSEIGTGTSYINISGQTGLVVPPSDAAALRAAMHQLWHDRELAETLGQAAAEGHRQLVAAEGMGEQYNNPYRKPVIGEAQQTRLTQQLR